MGNIDFIARVKARRAAIQAAKEKEAEKSLGKAAEQPTENQESSTANAMSSPFKQPPAEKPNLEGAEEIRATETTAAEQLAKEEETSSESSAAKDAPESSQDTTDEENSVEQEPAQEPENKASEEDAVAKEKEKEEKKEPRKRRAAKKKLADEEPENVSVQEFDAMDILGTPMSHDDAMALVLGAFSDDKWATFKKDITERLNGIKIEADMNPGTLRYVLADINNIYAEVFQRHADIKGAFEALTNKENGVCTAIRARASVGPNDHVRRANGFEALANVNYNNEKVNFIALVAGLQIKLSFLEGAIKRIQFMSNICITMSGALKLEKDLLPGVA